MKNMKIVLALICLMTAWAAKANTITIDAGGFAFTPDSINVAVGDTIKWVWVSGFHTTTSTTIPAGAVAWDAPLDNTHTNFSTVISLPGTYHYQCTFHVAMGMIGVLIANPIGIEPVSNNVPQNFRIYQNYPNPFNPSTTIIFDVAARIPVEMSVYDITGSREAILVNEIVNAGTYKVTWDASANPSGVYFVRFIAGSFSDTKKIVLIK